jgi:7-cyano-7-deazaguanine synthase
MANLPKSNMGTLDEGRALVVHSGGADSTICLHWALEKYEKVSAITFDYGQRHRIELECAAKICQRIGVEQKVVTLESLSQLGGNSLMDHDAEIESLEGQLPNTFVPGRNLLFMTLAGAWAWQIGAKHLVTGVCETDYSGYPDCREETMQALEQSLNLGMESSFSIHTPLMHVDKAASITMAKELDGCLSSLAHSHTCYEGNFPPCGSCPSCQLRSKGFEDAGISDPLVERAAQS